MPELIVKEQSVVSKIAKEYNWIIFIIGLFAAVVIFYDRANQDHTVLTTHCDEQRKTELSWTRDMSDMKGDIKGIKATQEAEKEMQKVILMEIRRIAH